MDSVVAGRPLRLGVEHPLTVDQMRIEAPLAVLTAEGGRVLLAALAARHGHLRTAKPPDVGGAVRGSRAGD